MFFYILLLCLVRYIRNPRIFVIDIIRIYTWFQINIYNKYLKRNDKKIRVKSITSYAINSPSLVSFCDNETYTKPEDESSMVCITLDYNGEEYYKFITYNSEDDNEHNIDEAHRQLCLACLTNIRKIDIDTNNELDITGIMNRILRSDINKSINLFHLKMFLIKTLYIKTKKATMNQDDFDISYNIITRDCQNITINEGTILIEDNNLIFE